jgi:hypothetical protein
MNLILQAIEERDQTDRLKERFYLTNKDHIIKKINLSNER